MIGNLPLAPAGQSPFFNGLANGFQLAYMPAMQRAQLALQQADMQNKLSGVTKNLADAYSSNTKGDLNQQQQNLIGQGYWGDMGQQKYVIDKFGTPEQSQNFISGTAAKPQSENAYYGSYVPYNQARAADSNADIALKIAQTQAAQQGLVLSPTKYGYAPGSFMPAPISVPAINVNGQGNAQGGQPGANTANQSAAQLQQQLDDLSRKLKQQGQGGAIDATGATNATGLANTTGTQTPPSQPANTGITESDFVNNTMKLGDPQPGAANLTPSQVLKTNQGVQSAITMGNRIQNLVNTHDKEGVSKLVGTNTFGPYLPTKVGFKKGFDSVLNAFGVAPQAYNDLNTLTQQGTQLSDNLLNLLIPGSKNGTLALKLGEALDPGKVPNDTAYMQNIKNLVVLHMQDLMDVANGPYPYNTRSAALQSLQKLQKLPIYQQAMKEYVAQKSGQTGIDQGNQSAPQASPTTSLNPGYSVKNGVYTFKNGETITQDELNRAAKISGKSPQELLNKFVSQ